MAISDELRKWARDNTVQDKVLTTYPVQHPVHGTVESLLRIADRIDAEHEEAIQREHETAYDAGYQDGENAVLAVFDKRCNADVDERMAEHGWYRALDADKQVIYANDELFSGGVSRGHVMAIGVGRSAGYVWTLPEDGMISISHLTRDLHHYHAPTVEDVLEEYRIRYYDLVTDLDCNYITNGEYEHGISELDAEYAAKLRLAGDAE